MFVTGASPWCFDCLLNLSPLVPLLSLEGDFFRLLPHAELWIEPVQVSRSLDKSAPKTIGSHASNEVRLAPSKGAPGIQARAGVTVTHFKLPHDLRVWGGMVARLTFLFLGLALLSACTGGNFYTGGGFRNYCSRTTSQEGSYAYNQCMAREAADMERRRSRRYDP